MGWQPSLTLLHVNDNMELVHDLLFYTLCNLSYFVVIVTNPLIMEGIKPQAHYYCIGKTKIIDTCLQLVRLKLVFSSILT